MYVKRSPFKNRIAPMNRFLLLLLMSFGCLAQPDPLISLIGKHPVGFAQVQQTLSVAGRGSTVCTVDVWYPIASPLPERYIYKDYMLLRHDSTEAERTLRAVRQTVHAFFGKTTDSAWSAVLLRKTLAYKNARVPEGRYPLILGMLRSFSTTNTCELLASHGYVVAMIRQVDDFAPDDSIHWNRQMRTELALYEGVIDHLAKDGVIDKSNVGLFGFSGSGFSQFFYAMQSARPTCLALAESGLYAEGLFEAVHRSGLYKPEHLNAPFLYFHNSYTDARNPYRREFDRIPGAKKLKMLYRDSTMHHWDYASEGFLSSAYLGNRPPAVASQQLKNYLNVNARIIDFFNAHLKKQRTNLTSRVRAGSEVEVRE